MLRFSANLGFLWTDRPLSERIRAAKATGFDAVECHWPYDEPVSDVKAALAETGLPMLSLNTRRGEASAGGFGLAAVPGREGEARAAIDEAIAYAAAIGARHVHVMAGIPSSDVRGRARDAFRSALRYAADHGAPHGIGILVEPLNTRDVPGYFLTGTEQAEHLIAEAGRPGIRLLFDCYHMQIMEGDLIRRIERLLPLIGHIQIAAIPSRAEPDEGEVAYDRLLPMIDALGYDGFVGAEYRPRGTTEEGLGWLGDVRRG